MPVVLTALFLPSLGHYLAQSLLNEKGRQNQITALLALSRPFTSYSGVVFSPLPMLNLSLLICSCLEELRPGL